MGRHHSRSRSRSRNLHVATPARSHRAQLVPRRDVSPRHERQEVRNQTEYGGRKPSCAPPRPGYDEDGRLQQLHDDPRYYEGAELGKAQRAAMGETGLNGRNTASFDPNSTLVRPAMRVMHATPGKKYGTSVKPDDVIAVPNFMKCFGDEDVYGLLAAELRDLRNENSRDPRASSTCRRIFKKACKYFSIDSESCIVSMTWCRPGKKPSRFEDAPVKSSQAQNCTATIAFGERRELTFWRSSQEDSIYFPLLADMLLLFSRDVAMAWKHGVGAVADESQKDGHISVEIKGFCSALVDEKLLVTKPAKIKQGPCRDFRIGKCAYGERCKFAHDDEGKSESKAFDPTEEIVRPSMRIITLPTSKRYTEPVKHDDVIIVPDFFGEAEGWDIYYQLIKEMRASQAKGDRKSEWIPWHEGAHLLSQNPEGSVTYHKVLDRMAEYFSVSAKNRGTRFNWYRDGSDWKPFHHDSAAFNADRAKNQNCTIGISFGAPRELAFRHAKTEELVYFPQTNGMLFYFGRDTNIRWQHGINALPKIEQDEKGRISIILWGWCEQGLDELGSPAMLDTGKGKDKGKGKGKGKDGKGGFSMHESRPSGACRDFKSGRCSYGDRCRFSHE